MFETVSRFRPSMDAKRAHSIVFEALYTFSTSGLAVFNVEEAQRRGVPTSGDQGKDYAINTQDTTRIMTIENAAEIYAAGYKIGLVNSKYSVEVYQALQAHLEHWVNYIDTFSMHEGDAPYEDLIKLEQFCAKIFSVARLHMKPNKVEHLWGASKDFSKVGVSAVFDIMNIKKEVDPKQIGNSDIFGNKAGEVSDGYPVRNSLLPLLNPLRHQEDAF